jgi:hypothetical protein
MTGMRGLIIAVLVLVGGCSKSDPRVCGSLPVALPKAVAETADDQMQLTAYCVERWAARLAAAPDDASEVVEAVVAACDGAIVAHQAMVAKEQPGHESPLPQEYVYWRGRAQFIVVQTRAGHCYQDA